MYNVDEEFFSAAGKPITEERKKTGWSIQGSWFSGYDRDFRNADTLGWLPEIYTWVASQQLPVIVDMFSENDGIRSFKRQFIPKKTIHAASVSLIEPNPKVQTIDDNRSGITHLSGDVNTDEPWKKLTHWLGDKQIHLFMERGHGALHYIPTQETFQRKTLARIWKMLHPNGGTAILQTPSYQDLVNRGIHIDTWLQKLDEQQIPYQFCKKYFDNAPEPPFFGMLILRKTPNHPILPDVDF